MPTKVKPFDTLDLIESYQSGQSLYQISNRLGVSRSVLAKQLTAFGVAIRGCSEAGKRRAAAMTRQERSDQAKAAHNATRGKRQTSEHRIKIAQAKEIAFSKAEDIVNIPSRYERSILSLLNSRGVQCVPQKAIGPYNIDIAITESSVAVEVFGGGWHATGRHAARFRKRTDYILNQGWAVVIVWCNRVEPTSALADKIVAIAKAVSTDKALRSKEIVLRGDGKRAAIGSSDADGRPVVPSGHRRHHSSGRYVGSWK